jgi:hypothetical protein
LSVTAKFRVNKDRVSIEIPEKNISQDKPNVVFFDAHAKQILGIGVPEEITRNDFLKQGKEISNNLKFGVSFQCDDEDSGAFDSAIVEYYLAVMYYEKQTFINYLFIGLFDAVDYDIQVADYEKWNEQRRLNFEYELQSQLHGRYLKINGINREIPIWKRNFEKTTRFLLTKPYVSILFFFLLIENSNSVFYFLAEKLPHVVFLVLFILTPWLLYIIGVLVWIFATRKALPKTYNNFIFQNLPLKSFEQKIVKFVFALEGKL